MQIWLVFGIGFLAARGDRRCSTRVGLCPRPVRSGGAGVRSLRHLGLRRRRHADRRPLQHGLLAIPIMALIFVALAIASLNDRRRGRGQPVYDDLDDDETSPLHHPRRDTSDEPAVGLTGPGR